MKEGDSKSALSQHQDVVISKPVTERVRVIDNESRNMHRKVKEAIHIKLQVATLNRTGGYDLPDLYQPQLREETRVAGRDVSHH